jgi:WD40 repeat protein
LKKMTSGHQGPIRGLVSAPSGPGFVSCSEDARAKYWMAS